MSAEEKKPAWFHNLYILGFTSSSATNVNHPTFYKNTHKWGSQTLKKLRNAMINIWCWFQYLYWFIDLVFEGGNWVQPFSLVVEYDKEFETLSHFQGQYDIGWFYLFYKLFFFCLWVQKERFIYVVTLYL